jgi:hypothetical protein
MTPKLAAAIITGTIARPSRPSVRFTALPAPTMTKAPKNMKNQPRLMTQVLGEREGQRGASGAVGAGKRGAHHEIGRDRRDEELDAEARLAGKALVGLLRDLEVVVIETDRAEAERDEQHDPDIDAGEVGPEQRRLPTIPRQDHQAAHGRRAGLLEMGLRTIGADRLALALAVRSEAMIIGPNRKTISAEVNSAPPVRKVM